jgi:hypothetical protein
MSSTGGRSVRAGPFGGGTSPQHAPRGEGRNYTAASAGALAAE